MDSAAIVLLVLSYVSLQVVTPLLVRALDRLYQREIDSAVSAGVGAGVSALFLGLQLLLILLELPFVILVWAMERRQRGRDALARLRRQHRRWDNFYVGVKALTSPDFRQMMTNSWRVVRKRGVRVLFVPARDG